jgi:hypothetical protein
LGGDGASPELVTQSMVQVNLVEALVNGENWELPKEKIAQLKADCLTDGCRQYFVSN